MLQKFNKNQTQYVCEMDTVSSNFVLKLNATFPCRQVTTKINLSDQNQLAQIMHIALIYDSNVTFHLQYLPVYFLLKETAIKLKF